MSEQKNIIILGAAFVGIPTAHKLLRTLPTTHKLILVNPSTHYYWNIAAPRAAVIPDAFGANNASIFHPIAPALTAANGSFIHGSATALDPAAATVTITHNDGKTETLSYDQLIITTGSRHSSAWPFRPADSKEATLAALAESQTKIEAANSIVISGGGPTSIELAGEIASFYPKKTLTLVSGTEQLLPTTKPVVGATAKKTLEKLGVKVITGTRATETPGKDSGVEVALSTGEVLAVDLHIPAVGSLPNTDFLPKSMLDDYGWVKVTHELRVEGYENLWAAGDVTTLGPRTSMAACDQVPILAGNVGAALKGERPVLKQYNPSPVGPIIAVPVGPKFPNGTGEAFGWKLPGVVVWALKGRSFFVGSVKGVAEGKALANGQKV